MVREGEPAPPGFRSRHRAKRRREFLDIARRIINEESIDSLTMQRLTDEVGGSVGSVYYYFPTRNALLGALQVEAFETLLASYTKGRADLEAFLAQRSVDTELAALTGVLANCLFWVESESTLPGEIALSRRLILGGAATRVEGDDPEVLPMALAILDEGIQRLDRSVEAGALDTGNNVERGVMLIASMTGFLLVSRLRPWDTALFDSVRLADAFATNALYGWGATREQLERASALLDEFRAHGWIAPPVEPS